MTRHVLVIGAQRSGTTTIYELLDAHPHISMARPRRPEPKVFLSDEVLSRGALWYRSTYFAEAAEGQVLGEKSTSYLEHPQAARRAAQVLDDVRIVAQLRDPVQRAVSNWRFSTAHGRENRLLPDALAQSLRTAQPWDGRGSSVSPFAYLERGHYVEQLQPWLDVFPGAVHVQLLEDGPSAPLQRRRLYQHLGVDPDLPVEAPATPVNASGGPVPELPGSLRDELYAHFEDSDLRLAELLGRRLPWRS